VLHKGATSGRYVFMIDLPSDITHSRVLMYTDDVKLCLEYKDTGTQTSYYLLISACIRFIPTFSLFITRLFNSIYDIILVWVTLNDLVISI